MSDTDHLRDRLSAFLSAAEAVVHLKQYFTDDGGALYTGRHFERLGGGGDRPEARDRVTAVDLVAVESLSVSVPVETSVALTEGKLGEQLSDILVRVPADIELADPAALEHVQSGSLADKRWQLLTEQPGVGYVTAGKLLARKRPHLLPVYDDVLRCALGRPGSWWTALHHALVSPVPIRSRIAELRRDAGVPDRVSDLRIVDVVVWMSHRKAHRSCGRVEGWAPR